MLIVFLFLFNFTIAQIVKAAEALTPTEVVKVVYSSNPEIAASKAQAQAEKELIPSQYSLASPMIGFMKETDMSLMQMQDGRSVPWISRKQVYDFLYPLFFMPEIRVHVFQKDLDSLLKDLNDYELDLVLSDAPYMGKSTKLLGHQLSTDSILCVGSPDKRLKGKFPECINGKKLSCILKNVCLQIRSNSILKITKSTLK